MQFPAVIDLADRDRMWNDWAETITFRQVATNIDPATQQVSETVTDTPIAAIIGRSQSEPAAGTAAGTLAETIEAAVKVEDLPPGDPALTDRFVRQGVEYDVVRRDLSAGGLVVVLRGRRRD